MRLRLKEAELVHLKAFLASCTDCEQLSAREYVLDLFDISHPISLDFVLVNGGIGIDGAAELVYSEADDGYYMGERVEDIEAVRHALLEAGALAEE